MTDRVAPKGILANRVIREMSSSGAILELGLDGFALVALVAMEWDGLHYARPVAFRLANLLERMGLKNKQAFYRIEGRCIDLGWLVKTPQNNHLPMLYTVRVPEGVKGGRFQSDDGPPIDEKRTENRTESGPQNGLKTDRSRTEPDPSLSVSLSPEVNPVPIPGPGAAEPDPTDLFKQPEVRAATNAEILGMFSINVKWFSTDVGRMEEMKSLLVACYRSYGLLALQTAERMKFEDGERVYADRLADRLAAESADRKRTEKRTTEKPVLSLAEQALVILDRDGWSACLARLEIPEAPRARIKSAKDLAEWLYTDVWARQLVERSKGAA